MDGAPVPVIEPLLNPAWALLFFGAAAGGALILLAVTTHTLVPKSFHKK